MKNNFEGNLNKPEVIKESILNDWDRKILLEGSKNIVKRILEEFDGKLPEAIIFPDSSARPIYYLMDPIFSKISKEQNTNRPVTYFFKVKSADQDTHTLEEVEGKKLSYEEAKIPFLEKLIEHKEWKDKYNDFDPEYEDYKVENFIKTHLYNRPLEKERAEEIKNYNKKQGIEKLAVIDEYASTGSTNEEINHAFGYNVPFFSIFGSREDNSVEHENIGQVVDIYEYPRNPANGRIRFSYSKKDNSNPIGVEKEKNITNKYSETIKNPTPAQRDSIIQLRKEMRELGEQIAKNF